MACVPEGRSKSWSVLARVAFVPAGQYDRSLARSAWDIATPRSRPVGYGLILRRCAHFDSVIEVWSDEVSDVITEEIDVIKNSNNSIIIGHFVPSYGFGVVLGDAFRRGDLRHQLQSIIPYPTGRFFGGRFPGTSCQATIVLSLRDEKYILRVEALVKLALMGLQPRVSMRPFQHLPGGPGVFHHGRRAGLRPGDARCRLEPMLC